MNERRPQGAIALATFGLHIAFAARYGWFRDELYYAACARRLAWGYVDHPPMVAAIARLAHAVFGDSLVGLRAFSALAAAVTVLVAAEIARAMSGGRFAQALAAFAAAVAPYDLVVGQIYSMNAFEPIAWGALALVFVRVVRDPENRARELYWLGPIVGLGVMNKYSAAWPAIALLVAAALGPARRLFRRKELWIATAIAALIVTPHVIWQIEHHFPTREFAKNALGKNEPYGVLGFVAQQVLLTHPLGALLWMTGLGALLFGASLRNFRPLGLAYLFVAALIVATQAKAYYLAPAYGPLFAAGAVTFERVTAARARWSRVLYVVLLAAGSAILLPVAIPILSETSFQRYAARLGVFGEARSGEKIKRSALPQLYADMHGWPEMAAAVDTVAERLSPRESVGVLAGNYGEAGAIEMFTRLPVMCGNDGYWLWGPPAAWPSAVVAVGYDADDLARFFGDVHEAARFDQPFARENERDLPIYVCRSPRMPVAEAWPRLKHYK